MPKQKLTNDPNTGELSRLSNKDLKLIGTVGLNDNAIIPFGESTQDFIEYCVYDLNDNYLASGEIPYQQLTSDLDVGSHIRGLGYERGTYKIVYNFLRQIGGSSKFILTFFCIFSTNFFQPKSWKSTETTETQPNRGNPRKVH